MQSRTCKNKHSYSNKKSKMYRRNIRKYFQSMKKTTMLIIVPQAETITIPTIMPKYDHDSLMNTHTSTDNSLLYDNMNDINSIQTISSEFII